jgi:hypothetical protein
MHKSIIGASLISSFGFWMMGLVDTSNLYIFSCGIMSLGLSSIWILVGSIQGYKVESKILGRVESFRSLIVYFFILMGNLFSLCFAIYLSLKILFFICSVLLMVVSIIWLTRKSDLVEIL